MQFIIKIRNGDVDFINGIDCKVEILKPEFWMCDYETGLPIISEGYTISLHPENKEHESLIRLKFGDRLGIMIR